VGLGVGVNDGDCVGDCVGSLSSFGCLVGSGVAPTDCNCAESSLFSSGGGFSVGCELGFGVGGDCGVAYICPPSHRAWSYPNVSAASCCSWVKSFQAKCSALGESWPASQVSRVQPNIMATCCTSGGKSSHQVSSQFSPFSGADNELAAAWGVGKGVGLLGVGLGVGRNVGDKVASAEMQKSVLLNSSSRSKQPGAGSPALRW